MKVWEAEEEIDKRHQEGAESIGFIGGEPTLYPHLERIVQRARQVGFKRIALCTNGGRLADATLLDRFLYAGVTRVTLSIHSHRAQVEDRITQRRGSFEEKIRAIRNLTVAMNDGRLSDGFSLNTVLHRKLLPSLEEFVAFFKKLGVSDIRFNLIRPEHQAVGSRKWVPPFKETTLRMLRLVVQNEAKFRLHLTFADVPLCKLPWEVLSNPFLRQRYVGENRDLATDVTLYRPESVGGVKRFNWKTQRTSYLKCQPPACDRCMLKERCEGVWRGYVDIYGHREFDEGPALAEVCVATM